MPKMTANFVALVQLCQFECYSAPSKYSPLRTENLRLTDKNARISDILAEIPLFSINVSHIGTLINILA